MFFYEYTVKDHLGNARVNFRANGAAIANLEDHHYYPFGMKMEGIGSSTATNKYTYNYKELNEDFGLNWHDYGARWYDAALGRWWSVDPLGEAYTEHSAYNYVMNNPLLFIDPNGMSTALWSYDQVNSSIEAHNEAARKEDQQFWQDFDRTTVRPEIGGPCTNCPSQAVTGANGDGVLGEVTVSARRPYSASPGQPKIFQWLGEFIVNHYDDQTVYGFTKGMIETTPVHGLYVFWNGTNMLPDEPNGGVYSEGSRVLAALSLVPVPGESQALKVAEDVAELSSLNPTHYITKSESVMKRFVSSVKSDGIINESILFVEHNGTKFIVDGHHRFFAAQKLGIQNVPVLQVQLPFRGYQTVADLVLSGKQPVWWKFYKP